MELHDLLFNLSDLQPEEYERIKPECTDRLLLSRSIIPELRNLYNPPGELYAPIIYNNDYMVKLVNKPRWGGHIVTMVIWDLLVIDIDQTEFEHVKANIMKFYPQELFYIHKTPRGFHLYMVSRQCNNVSRYAIFARIKLESDPAHGANSLYTGTSIRLSRKTTDIQGKSISQFYTTIGNGSLDAKALALYQTVQHYIAMFGDLQINPENPEHLKLMYDLWQTQSCDFGYVHIVASAPMTLTDVGVVLNPAYEKRSVGFDLLLKKYWSTFIKYRVLHEERLPYLLLMCQYNMGHNNLYRIYEATDDYAVGLHVQQNCHCIDYDHQRLKILSRYVRNHPEATFRVVRTNKGYHAFLTSYPFYHRHGINLLVLLCADPCHIVGTYHRGYSVRINKKFKTELPYREIAKIGKAPEDPKLLALYQKHFELYGKYSTYKTTCCQKTDAFDILKEKITTDII
jgi:hypothetical protein